MTTGDAEVQPLIDGSLSDSDSTQTVDVVNPSNGSVLLSIPEGTSNDVNRAALSSRAAFSDGRWSEAAPSFRKRTLQRFADLIEKGSAKLDALDAEEMGKPIRESFCNAAAAASLMRFYAEAIDKVSGDVFCSDSPSFVLQRRVPRGVVAAVVPWNFPTYNAVLKVAPALAAGNCVVLKPSELSSRSAMQLGIWALDAGIPPGSLNVVPGVGEIVGQALALHPAIDMLTFTGSSAVGKLMLQYAGLSNMKVVLAECGGKSPHIVFDDGLDLDEVADQIAGFLVTNQGQVCSVGSRLLVQRSAERRVLGRVVDRLKEIRMGDAVDPNTTYGPLASQAQCARVMGYIENAANEGAQLVAGGSRVRHESGGNFVEPTVFRAVDPNSKLGSEEVFGPVLATMSFNSEADAMRLANATAYGLAAYVWTSNLTTAMQMMKAVRSSVIVNAAPPRGEGPGFAHSHEPRGMSGSGTESGMAGLESYLHRQLVWFNH